MELKRRGYTHTHETGEKQRYTEGTSGGPQKKHHVNPDGRSYEFNARADDIDYAKFARDFGYTDKDIERYKAAEARMSSGNYRNGDLSIAFNFHSGAGGASNTPSLQGNTNKMLGSSSKVAGFLKRDR